MGVKGRLGMDFQVQMVPGNDFTMEVSAPRGKENNVNKNIDIRCPPSNVRIRGTMWKEGKALRFL